MPLSNILMDEPNQIEIIEKIKFRNRHNWQKNSDMTPRSYFLKWPFRWRYPWILTWENWYDRTQSRDLQGPKFPIPGAARKSPNECYLGRHVQKSMKTGLDRPVQKSMKSCPSWHDTTQFLRKKLIILNIQLRCFIPTYATSLFIENFRLVKICSAYFRLLQVRKP